RAPLPERRGRARDPARRADGAHVLPGAHGVRAVPRALGGGRGAPLRGSALGARAVACLAGRDRDGRGGRGRDRLLPPARSRRAALGGAGGAAVAPVAGDGGRGGVHRAVQRGGAAIHLLRLLRELPFVRRTMLPPRWSAAASRPRPRATSTSAAP